MTTATALGKSGLVEFKSQKEIIADRQRKTDIKFQALQKRVNTIMKESYQLAYDVAHEEVANK